MKDAINSQAYWHRRFSTGNWRSAGGFAQTREFARAQVPLLGLDRDFTGTLCDFGCGAGDAFPEYRRAFPKAQLCGVDFAEGAIRLARDRFNSLGTFLCGGLEAVPKSDVVIASNVLEHLDAPESSARVLAQRCRVLYVVVPYREPLLKGSEHINTFDTESFSGLAPRRRTVFAVRGWSEFGSALWLEVYLKNLARLALGRRLRMRARQIVYEIPGTLGTSEEAGGVD